MTDPTADAAKLLRDDLTKLLAHIEDGPYIGAEGIADAVLNWIAENIAELNAQASSVALDKSAWSSCSLLFDTIIDLLERLRTKETQLAQADAVIKQSYRNASEEGLSHKEYLRLTDEALERHQSRQQAAKEGGNG